MVVHAAPALLMTCSFAAASAFFLVVNLGIRWRVLQEYHNRLKTIEGDLPARLQDGSLLLLRVAWLVKQPSDWVLKRRQDMPEDAFYSPAEAFSLLQRGMVAALSYRWLAATKNDPDRFHLNAVLDYYREDDHLKRHPAILIDFASLPQIEPMSVSKQNPWGSRSKDDEDTFKKGLAVVSAAGLEHHTPV